MPRVTKKQETEAKDTLEVIHHTIPETAAGAGAAPIPEQRGAEMPAAGKPSYKEGGTTWRRMLRGVAIAEAVGFVALMGAGMAYGLDPFFPIFIAALLWAGSAYLLPRMTKASAVYSLVIASLTLVMFGGLFFGWSGFLYPRSWFEMSWATLTVLLPAAGVTAAIATLRHHDGTNAAKTPARTTAAVSAAVVLIGAVGTLATGNDTRLPGDNTISAQNLEFEQTAINTHAGDVAIYFENKDPFVHNVKIDGYGASKNADSGKSIRHVFKGMPAGTYTYYCEIHTDMKGTLTLT